VKTETLVIIAVVVIVTVIVASVAVNHVFFSRRYVSWKSKEVFAHYENVTVPRNVSVSIPVVTLSAAPEGYNAEGLATALHKDMAGILRLEGLSPQFIGEEIGLTVPKTLNISEPKINGPVVFIFIRYYGSETNVLYRECYASVLIYMNSNPDVGSYLSMVNRYSKEDHLSFLAGWLFRRAKANETGPYSLKVVYWDTLRARISSKANETCWDVLAGEIANETKGWVKTLRPSGGS